MDGANFAGCAFGAPWRVEKEVWFKTKSNTPLALALVLSLFILSAGELLKPASADFIYRNSEPITEPIPTFIVYSPVNGSTYTGSKPYGFITGMTYQLDEGTEQAIPVPSPTGYIPDFYDRAAFIPLNQSVLDGSHQLKIICYMQTRNWPAPDYQDSLYNFSAVCATVTFGSLSQANTAATAAPTAVHPSEQLSQNPAMTPTVPELQTWLVVISLIATSSAFLGALSLRRKTCRIIGRQQFSVLLPCRATPRCP